MSDVVMTKSELVTRLKEIGWSQAELSRRIRVYPNTVSAWATGKVPVPGYVLSYLEVVRTLVELRTALLRMGAEQ